MKILRFLGFTFLILTIAFLALGAIFPSFEYSCKISVLAPPEKCWTVLHDTTRMRNWIPGFISLTHKSGEPLHPGAVYEIVLVQDKVYVMEESLREVTAPTHISSKLTNDVLVSENEYTLTRKNLQTEIINYHKVTGNNLIWRSLLFLSQSYLKDEDQKQLDLLKLEIETGEVEFD